MPNLRGLFLGDPTAEADGSTLFEKGCFVETDIYQECLALRRTAFVVGRRGAGKTATRLALHKAFISDRAVVTTVITPQGFQVAQTKSLAKLLASHVDVHWEFLFTSLWATTLRVQWARGLLDFYKLRDTDDDDVQQLRSYMATVAPDDSASAEEQLATYIQSIIQLLSQRPADPVAAVTNMLAATRSERITKSIGRVATASGVKLLTLVDGLDENWDGSNTSAEFISGLLTQAAVDYAAIGAISYVFIRENMYRRVSNISPRWDRIEGYFIPLMWTEEQIRELIEKRVNAVTDEGFSWADVFEPTVLGTPSLEYVLRRTQFKPREVILLCKYAIETAARHRSPVVRERDILDAESRYSENRLKDLINEYQDSLPELRAVIEIFVGVSEVLDYEEFGRIVDDYIGSGRYGAVAPRLSLIYPSREGILDLLLGIGFLGVRIHGAPEFVFKYYGEQGNVFREPEEIQQLGIHPAFKMALGLKASVGQDVKLKEASDSDIIAASTSVTIRLGAAHEEASTIIGTLNDIAPGPAGFRRYEELVKQAVEFAFRGYVDNGHIQERNWSGTQVRDLVFDNTGETNFFNLIRNKHGAISIVFECKNKLELEPADFHQIEVRLGDPSGHFGFVCYRAQRSEPVKREIEFIREIYRRDQRRMVLLLTDVKLLQLIEKRTKGKTDKFLYGWYSTYFRNYLT